MTSPLVRLGLLALVVALSAPAAQAQQQDSTPKKATRARGDRNKLTRVEIDGAGTGIVTAHDAIRLLRPLWLRPNVGRNVGSNMGSEGGGATEVVIYIDDLRQPDIQSSLVTVSAAQIVEIRYLEQNRAVQMRGPGHEAGVIEIITNIKRK